MPTAIMGAMPEEISSLRPLLRGPQARQRAGREFIRGRLGPREVVLAFSRWGKVAAASTATELILSEGVDSIVFCGVAGALDAELEVGDVVVADRLYQHDLDASPFFRPLHVPIVDVAALPTDMELSGALLEAAQGFLTVGPGSEGVPERDWNSQRAVRGDIASGDRVVASTRARDEVRLKVPSALAVEMEGAAVAQVCLERGVRFACVRMISDSADENVEASFSAFIPKLAGIYTAGIIARWLGIADTLRVH